MWDGTNWIPHTITQNINDLGDVTITTPSTDDLLKWNGTSWINFTPSFSTVANINDLGDVTVTTPSTNDLLKWNGTSWINFTPSYSTVATLNDLSDVSVTTPSTNDLLKWNGTSWINFTPNYSTVTSIDNLSDVDTSTISPTVGYALMWDGTNWIPHTTDIYLDNILDVSVSAPTTGYVLAWSGSNWYAADPTTLSDERDKTGIRETQLGLNFINKIKAVDFKYNRRKDYIIEDENGNKIEIENDGSKSENNYHNGVLAQQVKEVMDELNVDFGGFIDHNLTEEKDVLSIDYREFVSPLIKAVQELKKEKDDEISKLRKEIEEIKSLLK